MNDEPWAHPENCHAHSRQTGEQCGNRPIPGGTVCRFHGGGSPRARAAAERKLRAIEVDEDARAVLAHEGIEPIGDPLDELGKLASAAQAMADALGARVNAIRDVTTMDDHGKESIRAEIVLYERAIDRSAKLLEMLVKAGFMERQVKIQEGTGEAVALVLRRIFERLQLTPEQQALIGTVVPEELRVLEM